MGDVAEGPAWTKTGVISSVWRRFGLIASRMITVVAPGGLELLGGHRLARSRVAHDDAAEPVAQVRREVWRGRGSAMTSRRRGDVEPVSPVMPTWRRAEADARVAQGPVVDVEHPVPGNLIRIQTELVPVEEAVVQRRRDRAHAPP